MFSKLLTTFPPKQSKDNIEYWGRNINSITDYYIEILSAYIMIVFINNTMYIILLHICSSKFPPCLKISFVTRGNKSPNSGQREKVCLQNIHSILEYGDYHDFMDR